MAKKQPTLPPPTVPPCMLFCDAVIIEQGTGKTTLVGTFSGVAAPVFPSPPRDFHIYVQMTSFVGEKPMRLTCIRTDLPEPEEIYSSQHIARFRDKLTVEQVHFVWRQFELPNPGEYLFQLWCEGQCIAERRLAARVKGDSA